MNEWLILGWVFVAVAGAAFIIINRLGIWRRNRMQRLQSQDPDGPPPLTFGAWTPALAKQLPLTPEGEADLKQDLRSAGFYRPSAFLEYAAVRTLLVILPLIGAGVWAFLAPNDQVFNVLIGGLVATLLGYSLPRIYITMVARTRAREISRGLPVAIDLLTLCLTAGQNILTSLEQTARELSLSHPALSEELQIVEQQTRLHSLEQALQQLADRVHVPEVRNLALLLIQSERLGTDTASTLLEYSANLRTSIRQRAEARASRASFWLLFPSVFCLFVSAAIILIGPSYLEFWQYRKESRRLLDQSQTNVQQANRQGPASNNAPLTSAAGPATTQIP
jgi:tight adherence protein C